MWKDSDSSGGKLCVKVSFSPGETGPDLVPGELALNAADGLLYFKDSAGAVASLGVASVAKVEGLQDALNAKVGNTQVVAIQLLPTADYNALTPPVSTTLYMLTDATSGNKSICMGETILANKP